MKEALYYEKAPDRKVRCRLCPHTCLISENAHGFCGVRTNRGGTLYSDIYGKTTGVALDPIEKKPLYHFHPGEYILSLGTKGCNFRCGFCQNWHISQDTSASVSEVTPADIVQKAGELDSFGIAYTYNEPFIWYEFVLDTAKLARQAGLENVLVTNGFVSMEPLEEILPFIGAMNIDLKAFDEKFYREICHGRIGPVQEVIKRSKRSCHIELTTLLVTGLNDSEEEIAKLVDWIAAEVGRDTPLHLSRYFPSYEMALPPTPVETLKRAERIAKKKLVYVHLGNI